MAFAQKFIVADDHPLFRAALTQALRQLAPQAEIVESDTMEATTDVVTRHPDADLILLDLHMPGAHGFSGLIQLRGQTPDIPVAVVSGSDEVHVVRRAIDYGASGFIPKSSSLQLIAEAVGEILDGEVWLPAEMAEALGEANEDETRFAEAIASLTPSSSGCSTCSPRGCSTSRSPTSSTSPRRPSRPTSPPFSESSACTPAPRR